MERKRRKYKEQRKWREQKKKPETLKIKREQ